MASPEEKANDQLLSTQDIATLPRWAQVALAVRCAIRVAPWFRPYSNHTPEETRSDFIVLDICQTLAMLSSVTDGAISDVTYTRALNALVTYERVLPLRYGRPVEPADDRFALAFNLTFLATSAARLAGQHAAADALKTYYQLAALIEPDSPVFALVAQEDYRTLRHLTLGKSDAKDRAVPPDFYNIPLWGTMKKALPKNCWKVVEEWGQTLRGLRLVDIYDRYVRMCDGKEINWRKEAARRVKTWEKEKLKQAESDAVEKPTRQPQQKLETVLPGEKPFRPPDLRMLSDEALKDEAGDRLDFKPYANALAGLINNPKTKTPLTLAINAPWGAGKTTLARMIQRRLEGKPAAGGKRPHVTSWFNAWMHDDAPRLASVFAAEIARAANRTRPMWRRVIEPLPSAVLRPADRLRRKTFLIMTLLIAALLFSRWLALHINIPTDSKDLLDRIILTVGTQKSAFAVVAGLLAVLARVVSALAPLAKSLAGFIAKPQDAAITASMKQVSDQLGNLIKQATPQGSRFVIFVDDIERCQAPRSVEVLEVVNQLLGHEGVVTVLMADMPAVAACAQIKYEKLAQIYTPSGTLETNGRGQAYGRAYLQKIIQLQFDLPPYDPAKIHGLIQTLAKEAPEVSSTAEAPELLPAKGWKTRLIEYLRSIETGDMQARLRQQIQKRLDTLRSFIQHGAVLKDLLPLVTATADWQQGFAPRSELRLLSPARTISWPVLALPRWLVSRVDQWAYPRPQGWSAFWPGKSWYRFSWGLDVFCFLYLSALVGTLAAVPAIADFYGYSALLEGLFPELAVSRLGKWLIFDLHFFLLILAIILIGALAWLRSHIQQRRDSTVLQQARHLISKRPDSGNLDSKAFQTEIAQAIGVKVSEELLQEEIQAHVADESELRKEAEEEIMNYLPPLPRNAKRALNRLRLLLAIAYERKMFGDSSGITAKHIGKWAVLSERWPELAHELSLHPDTMDALERKAGQPKKTVFEKYLSGLTPDYATDAALRKFCRSQPTLGPIMTRLVHFESTSPPTGTPTTQPSS